MAIVLALVLIGAQPAAAAQRTHRTTLDRVASFWGAVLNSVPGANAALSTVTGWFDKMSDPQATTDRGFGIDPNGTDLISQPAPTDPPPSGQN